MEEKEKNAIRLIREEMSEKDFELYMYSLQKLADKNLDNNMSFMTDLYNIRAFQVKASEEMLQNPDLKFAMIILDFANFSMINEFCGREKGDELLKYTADTLRELTAEHVVLSHLRADIFAVFTPFNDKNELIAITKKIDAKIGEFKIPYRILPAFGICIADSPTMSVSIMRDYATMALDSIKGKFYAKYAFFDEEMRDRMLLNKMIENDIVSALEEEQLVLYIQPKVNMRTGAVEGGEALVRWHHPERGIVPPGNFIPVLEKNGLIIDVDICIWRQVFRFLGNRIKEGKKIVPISINISRQHVFDNSFKDRLINLSKEYNVSPDLVPLELTESGFLENHDMMYERMRFLKDRGFKISMDDFGSGYSNMSMLKNETMDEIKIDKGFVDDIATPKGRSILKHVIEMLQEIGLNVIVEGVEEPEQRDFLLKCGCTKAQGFYYYKPMPTSDFEALLDEWNPVS